MYAAPEVVPLQGHVTDEPVLENGDHDAEKKFSNAPSMGNEDRVIVDSGVVYLEPKHPDQVLLTCSDESKGENAVRRHLSRIPAILPMPLSFRKNREEIQKQQEQQRLRILSILESEDQSALDRDKQANVVSTLRQTPDHDSLSLNLATSTELSEYIIGSKDSTPTSGEKSRRLKWPPTKQHGTAHVIVQNVEDEDHESKKSVVQNNLVDSETAFDCKGRATRLNKKHLRNTVIHARAERVIEKGTLGREVETSRLEPEVELEQELKPGWSIVGTSHQHEYLGKQKSPHSIFQQIQMRKEIDKICKRETPSPRISSGHHKEYLGKKKSSQSILQEKRIPKGMGKIVKSRLRTFEESEEATEASDRVQPFCGCNICPT
jgi:hypothetical protein